MIWLCTVSEPTYWSPEDGLHPEASKTPMLDAALIYGAHGLRVFPLLGKLPAVSRREGGRGFHDATTDAAQIREWWKRWPGANVGWALPDGWCAVDIDPRHGGDLAALMIQRAHGAWPMTLRQTTGTDGEHWIWCGEVSQSEGRFDGLDTRRGGRGYLVVAPSIHPITGKPYRWHTMVDPKPIPPALAALFAPSRLVSVQAEYVPPANATGIEHATCVCVRCAKATDRGKDARHAQCICEPCKRIRYAHALLAGVLEDARAAGEGQRRKALWRAWKRCAEYRDVLPQAEVKRALLSVASTWYGQGKPPFTEREAERELR